MVMSPAPVRWDQLDSQTAKIVMRAETAPERQMRIVACRKEPWTVQWIEAIDPPTSVLWDIGASTGPYSLLAGSRGISTVAFEPAYASYAALVDNLLANPAAAQKIVPLCLALADVTGLVALGYRSLEAGAGSHVFGATQAPKIVASLPAMTMRGDDACRLLGLVPPTHLKLDVDGAESRVLAGLQGILASGRLRSVMLELSTGDLRRGEHLEAAGFKETARFTERAGKPIGGGIMYARWERA